MTIPLGELNDASSPTFSKINVTPDLHSLQLHSSSFQAFIFLLKLERVSNCFMSLGTACHNLHPRNDIFSKP